MLSLVPKNAGPKWMLGPMSGSSFTPSCMPDPNSMEGEDSHLLKFQYNMSTYLWEVLNRRAGEGWGS